MIKSQNNINNWVIKLNNKLIIFDLDGTLFTTEDVTIAAIKKLSQKWN